MKFAADRPFADPDQAARKLLDLANAAEADRDQGGSRLNATNKRKMSHKS
jgi:hypothetical protein